MLFPYGRVMFSVITSTFLAGALALGQTNSVSIDKQQVENYLCYAEGFSSAVKFAIDDPKPASIPGYFSLNVHLTMGAAKQDKTYYLSGDGKQIFTGEIWSLNANPFREIASKIPTDGPSFGPADAKVTMVVFSDFQCPYCREFARTIRETLPQKYPKDVRVIFEDFPIESIHPWAEGAAEAARCVAEGKSELFWTFHDWVFDHQGEINRETLPAKVAAFAKEHSLDTNKVQACLDSHAMKSKVQESVARGRALGIEQTPTFYINGRSVPGALKWDALNTLIQMELNRPNNIPDLSAQK
jgi:protein-disulfide isomerase